MPVCPNCGTVRIDRYCARCGFDTTAAPVYQPVPVVPVLPPRHAGTKARGIFFTFLGIALLLGFGISIVYTVGSYRSAPQFTPSGPPPSQWSPAGLAAGSGDPYSAHLRDTINQEISRRQARVSALVERRAFLATAGQRWQTATADTEAFLNEIREASASYKGNYYGPVIIRSRRFERNEIDGAITACRSYLAGADSALSDLSSASLLAERGIAAGQYQIDSLRNILRSITSDVSMSDPRTTVIVSTAEQQVIDITNRWQEIPDPTTLGQSNSNFRQLQLGTAFR